MASIHRDPRNRSPYLYAAFTLPDGTRCFRSTKLTDKKKAMALAIEFEREGRDVAERDPTGAQIGKVVRDILERATGARVEAVYVGEFLRGWAERAGNLKAKRTAMRYRQVVDDFLSYLGKNRERARVGSITESDVQGFIDAELKSGKAKTTVAISLKVLRIPFNRALKSGDILRNPVTRLDMPDGNAQERKAFSWDQTKSLIAAADGDWQTAIMLGAYCGMRLGDCINLKWSNVGLESGLITYVPEKTSHGKRRKEITVPIHDSLKVHLTNAATSKASEEWVCPTLQGRSVSGRSGLSMEFITKIMPKAGVKPDVSDREVSGKGRQFNRLSFHSLRHTFNSELANRGVAQELRMKLAGHASEKVNDKYSHFESKTLTDAVGKLPGH